LESLYLTIHEHLCSLHVLQHIIPTVNILYVTFVYVYVHMHVWLRIISRVYMERTIATAILCYMQ